MLMFRRVLLSLKCPSNRFGNSWVIFGMGIQINGHVEGENAFVSQAWHKNGTMLDKPKQQPQNG